MYCLTLPRLRECYITCEERRNKNKKQLVYSRGGINSDCGQVVDWTATLTLTLNLTLTIEKEKVKYFDSNVCLKLILKWTIFSGAGDRLAQKMSSSIELLDCLKAYYILWSVLICSSISCTGDRLARKMFFYVEL